MSPSNNPDSISEIFYTDPTYQIRWKHFLQNIEKDEKDIELSKVVTEIKEFLQPIISASLSEEIFDKTWSYTKKWS